MLRDTRQQPELAGRVPSNHRHEQPDISGNEDDNSARVTSPSTRIRKDIQALRGLAVLAVLFYHARLGHFSGGYLGVDVFFVISGFLITRVVKDGVESGTFQFSRFYLRRAKRLLPAAYVTFVATALLAPAFLTSSEMREFQAQLAGAVTFSANFVLWRQAGYFGGAAELKPLLHVWSLAIEEQFYFFLPAAMVFTPKRFWKLGVASLLTASLALCLIRGGKESTFYLLPTRAWELAIGAAGALAILNAPLIRLVRLAFWPALAAVALLPLVNRGRHHPGLIELVACVATLVVILRSHPRLRTGTAIATLGWVGDMSYSLYLVHWPLFAFFHNTWMGPETVKPIGISVGLVALSLLLAYLLHRYVEEPARRLAIPAKTYVLLAAVTSAVVVLIGVGGTRRGATQRADFRRPNFGFAEACDFAGAFSVRRECRNSDRPEILVWGDSYAMHIVPGILATPGGPPALIQATRHGCGPMLGLAQTQNRTWAKSCIGFNESVAAYLKKAASIKIVVLSSLFDPFVADNGRLLKQNARLGTYQDIRTSLPEAIAALRRTADMVRAAGKRLVIVGPPPMADFDLGRCLERRARRLLVTGLDRECSIEAKAYQSEGKRVLQFLSALPQQAGVQVISLGDSLCDAERCKTRVGRMSIYRDAYHLSYDGSKYVAKSVSLLKKIKQLAR